MMPWVASGAARPEERLTVYLHTAGCDRCRQELARTIALGRRVDRCAVELGRPSEGAWDRFAALAGQEGAPLAVPPGPDHRAREEGSGRVRGPRLARQLLSVLDAAGLPALVSGVMSLTIAVWELTSTGKAAGPGASGTLGASAPAV